LKQISAQDDPEMKEMGELIGESLDDDSNDKGSKAKGGKKGMRKIMEKICSIKDKKKEKLEKFNKGKGMFAKLQKHCEKVKKGEDTEEGDRKFMDENIMSKMKTEEGGEGGSGKKEKIRNMFDKLKGAMSKFGKDKQ
jgi:uncharacterized protein YyaL (SSP411 family)